MIHARPRLSRCRIPSWWSMLDPDSHTISCSTRPRFCPCLTQTLSQLHAAESPVLMIHAQPKLSCSRIPRFDGLCSAYTLTFMPAESQGLIHALPRLPVSCIRSPRFDPFSSLAVTALYYTVTWALTGKVDQMLGLNILFIHRDHKLNK